MPLRQRGELGSLPGGPRPQLGGSQRQHVLINNVEAAPAGAEHPPRVSRRLRPQALGQPSVGARRRGSPAVSAACRGRQVTLRLLRPAQRQRHPAGQQASPRRIHGPERVKAQCRPFGLAQQARGHLAGRVAGLQHQESGPRVPPWPPLNAEQAAGGLGAQQRRLRIRAGQRRASGREQQLSDLRCLAAVAFKAADCRIGVSQRVGGEAGRKQHGAPVDAQVRHRNGQLLIAADSFVQMGKRGRQVTGAGRRQPAVVPRVDPFQLLAGHGEQALGGGEIGVRASGGIHVEIDHPARSERAGFPDRVAGAMQNGDRPAQVLQRLRVLAYGPQRDAAPLQDASRRRARRVQYRLVQRRKPGLSPACIDQRDSERRQHVRLTLQRATPPGQAQCGPQLTDPGAHIAELAQHDANGLAGDGSVIRAGILREDRPRAGERIARAGKREKQQLKRPASSRGTLAGFPRHGNDAKGGVIRTPNATLG